MLKAGFRRTLRSNVSLLSGVRKCSVRFNSTVTSPKAPLDGVDDAQSAQSLELAKIIKKSIDATGPVSISAYMRECLLNPKYGYYTTRDPLDDKKGDFITSPEISSTFGEMIGIWFFSMFINQLKWQAINNRENFRIAEKTFRFIEYGPGRGTLMADVLRVLNRFIKKNNPIEVVFIEKSPVLIREQHKATCGTDGAELNQVDEYTFTSTTKEGNKVIWLMDDKPTYPKDQKYMNFVLAHEFFDALPINRFIKKEDGWREYLIDLQREFQPDPLLPNVAASSTPHTIAKKNGDSHPEFCLVESPVATLSSSLPKLDRRYTGLPVGSKVEICSSSVSYIHEMGAVVAQGDIGAGLVIDYGQLTPPTDSLRGIRKQKFVDPLTRPGEVDLSADVDFGNLMGLLAENVHLNSKIAEQGDWLNRMGLGYRIDQLIDYHKNDTEIRKKLAESYKRLAAKGRGDMGKVYKVMGFYDPRYIKIESPGFDVPRPTPKPKSHKPHDQAVFKKPLDKMPKAKHPMPKTKKPEIPE